MSNWISVNERLPDEFGVYLTYWSDGAMETYDYESPIDGGWDIPLINAVITHWQPLPEPPE